jgi:uncharacterized protein YggT (Ycf19 family)
MVFFVYQLLSIFSEVTYEIIVVCTFISVLVVVLCSWTGHGEERNITKLG